MYLSFINLKRIDSTASFWILSLIPHWMPVLQQCQQPHGLAHLISIFTHILISVQCLMVFHEASRLQET